VNSATRVDGRSLKQRHDLAVMEARELKAQGREQEAKLKELEAAELDREPQRHVGYKAAALERNLEIEKAQLRKAGKSVDHLPEFATIRGAERARIQREAKERHGVVENLKARFTQLWERGKAAIREVIQPEPKAKAKPTPAEQRAEANNYLADLFEKDRSVETHRDDYANLICDSVFGNARGERFLKDVRLLKVGTTVAHDLRGTVQITVTRETENRYKYGFKTWAGKAPTLVDALRDDAKSDVEAERKQQERSQRPQERVNVKQRGGRGD
jgi:hypothetical protein